MDKIAHICSTSTTISVVQKEPKDLVFQVNFLGLQVNICEVEKETYKQSLA